MKKFILSFFIAIIFIVVGEISVEASSTFDEEMLELIESSTSDYGYNYLGTLENGEELQEIYREIDIRAKEMMLDYKTDYNEYNVVMNTVKFYEDDEIDSKIDFRFSNLTKVFKVYYEDNPFIYFAEFYGNAYDYYEEGEVVGRYYEEHYKIYREYLLGKERERINKKILEKSKEIKKKTEGYTSKYLITRIVYNEICKGIKYEYDENGHYSLERHAHDIVGFFDNESGVCETYARVMHFLLRYCGIESIYVEGFAKEYHAWNAVKMDDGNWYWFDATWDDAGNRAVYDYFCKGNQSFISSHEIIRARNRYDIPETTVDETNVESFNKLVVDGVEYRFSGINLYVVKNDEGKNIPSGIRFGDVLYTVLCPHSEKEEVGFDSICRLCGLEFKHKHTVKFIDEVDSTCLNEGLTEGEICSICGEILFPQEVIPKKEHILEEWVIEWEATYDYDGLKSRKCEMCRSIIEEEIIPKLVREVEDNVAKPKNQGCNSASITNMIFLLVPIMFIKRKKYII